MIKCLSIKPFMHHILYHIPLEGERGKIGFLFFLIKVDMKRKFLFSHMKMHEKQE